MIKRLLPILIGLFPLAVCADPETGMTVASGGWADIDEHVRRLAQPEEYAVLVIEVDGSDAFLQFSATGDDVQLTFPLISEAQEAREGTIREFLESRELPAEINRGSDGARFLDSNLPPDADFVSRVARDAFQEIFGIGESARFQFRGQGLAPAP